MKRALLLGVLVLAACTAPPRGQAEVELYEFAIQVDHVNWSSGHVEVEVENHGQFPHAIVVSRQDGTVVDALEPLASEESRSVVLDLEPGRYQLTCRIVSQTDDGELVDHYQRGMRATVVVKDGP